MARAGRMGSSPLARGLRVAGLLARRLDRIIPARAGFTGGGCGSGLCWWDHPRSRGVYSSARTPSAPPTGSSPLARGLPRRRRRGPLSTGIIPARAGFTSSPTGTSSTRPDHPRSRGVYFGLYPISNKDTGSSPLARGLPRFDWLLRDTKGIIPARAGFTCSTSTTSPPRWDHPRSRGVYDTCVIDRPTGSGSSPLARGLPEKTPERQPIEGIIPARAGFTQTGVTDCSGFWDHPRSRGVYFEKGVTVWHKTGSSPLARGLRIHSRRVGERKRIIPARAGFTPHSPPSSAHPEDHPRSRGVYFSMHRKFFGGRGSSPLARGLPFPAKR